MEEATISNSTFREESIFLKAINTTFENNSKIMVLENCTINKGTSIDLIDCWIECEDGTKRKIEKLIINTDEFINLSVL